MELPSRFSPLGCHPEQQPTQRRGAAAPLVLPGGRRGVTVSTAPSTAASSAIQHSNTQLRGAAAPLVPPRGRRGVTARTAPSTAPRTATPIAAAQPPPLFPPGGRRGVTVRTAPRTAPPKTHASHPGQGQSGTHAGNGRSSGRRELAPERPDVTS